MIKNINEIEKEIVIEYLLKFNIVDDSTILNEVIYNNLKSELYKNGENSFFVFNSKGIVFSASIIENEISTKGIVYINGVRALSSITKFDLMYFQNVIETYNELKIIIGVNEEFNFIEDIMLNFDYKKSYSILQMKRNLKDFQYIDKQNIRKAQCNECKDIVEINNSAFLNILNGSTMSIKECKELFNDDTKKVFIMYKNNKKIGYSILEKNLIDTIAIHENFKLQGFGSKMVNFLLYKISEEYENAVLTVVDKNEQALNLYKKKGFIVDKVVSTWYEFLKLK